MGLPRHWDREPRMTMQDKNEVETKTMKPAEDLAASEARLRANREAEVAARFRKLKPSAEGWIVIMDCGVREEAVKSITLGGLNLACDKPHRLERRQIDKVKAYVAAQGTRLKFLELPESWKGWK